MTLRGTALALGLSAGLALAALTARAAEPQPPASPTNVAAWRGRYCTPTGCPGAPPASRAATLAGFGTAVVAAGWISRRHSRPRR